MCSDSLVLPQSQAELWCGCLPPCPAPVSGRSVEWKYKLARPILLLRTQPEVEQLQWKPLTAVKKAMAGRKTEDTACQSQVYVHDTMTSCDLCVYDVMWCSATGFQCCDPAHLPLAPLAVLPPAAGQCSSAADGSGSADSASLQHAGGAARLPQGMERPVHLVPCPHTASACRCLACSTGSGRSAGWPLCWPWPRLWWCLQWLVCVTSSSD